MKDRNSNRVIDKNWEEIFEHFNVVNRIKKDGIFYISSKEINTFTYQKGKSIDARNMTKFDYVSSLPDVFMEHKLNILPVSRGKYVIGTFEAYTKISESDLDFRKDRQEVHFPEWIETIDYGSITSESTMLNTAMISGMLTKIFKCEQIYLTVSGRMSSKNFTFNIDDSINSFSHNIEVNNSQLEIDAGFETENELIIVEAKNNTTNTFITRQLYYPYRLWKGKINKKVIPVYLQYSNGTYNFSVFNFEDEYDYNSIKLVERHNFIIGSECITMEAIVEIINNVSTIEDPPRSEVPFPQANVLRRVIDTMNAIYNSEVNSITLEELTITNDFHYRQAQYYSRAGIYLGLMYNKDGHIHLTQYGLELMHKSDRDRKLKVIESVFKHKPFLVVAKERLIRNENLNGPEAYKILKNEKSYLKGYAEETRFRRAGTIAAWIKQIFDMIDDY